MSITIPSTIDEVVESLNGLGRLLLAKEWERAAIVYAFTEDQQGSNQYRKKLSDALGIEEFANLGIQGLATRVTVRRYRDAWQTAIDVGEASPVRPGEDVDLPTSEWPPTDSRTGNYQDRIASGIRSADPATKAEVARELLNDPEVAEEISEEVTEFVASDSKRTAQVVRKARDAEPIPDATEGKRPKRDYSAMVEQHVNGLSVALAAESSGVWKPTEHDEALLYFLAQILGNRNEPKGEQADFVNEKLENLFAEAEAYANNEAS